MSAFNDFDTDSLTQIRDRAKLIYGALKSNRTFDDRMAEEVDAAFMLIHTIDRVLKLQTPSTSDEA